MLVVAGTAWSAALPCVLAPEGAWWVAAACVLCAVTMTLGLVRRQHVSQTRPRGAVLVIALVVGAAVATAVAVAQPGRSAAARWDGRAVEALGTVSSSAAVGDDGRLWMQVQLSALGSPGRTEPVDAAARVGVEPGEGYDLGAVIRVTGEAAVTDPGEQAALVVFATTSDSVRPAEGVFAIAAHAKSDLVARSLRLPEPGAGLLPGLAVGDTRAVSSELDDDMRASGLSHLTAVSGANCAIVVGAAFGVTAWCGGGRRMRIVMAALALGGFVILVTPEPSVVRAAVMASAAMGSILLGRPSAGAGLLALSAAGILVFDPWMATSAGFALSVVASGALILLARPLARGLERWMPRTLALALGVPLSAQLACGPVIALFAEQQSLIGVAANMIADPAAPLATVIGLLACLAGPAPPIADVLTAAAWLPAAWIATTAYVAADVPWGQIAVVSGLSSALVVALVSAAVAVVLLPGMSRDRTASHRWWRAARAAAAILLVSIGAIGAAQLLLSGPLATAATPEGWSVAACDVGQGDALVVRSSGYIALIDTGPDPAALSSCLRSLGVGRISLLVLTHFDLDHAGGVSSVIGAVDRVLHGPPADADDRRTIDELVRGGAAAAQAATGMQGTLGDARWRILWPARSSAAFPSGNDASVVIEFEGGGVPRSLFLGDLSAAPQCALARAVHLSGGYDVVKVAHHGSADQDPDLYRMLRPSVALISVGEGNDYGHPRADTLALLEAVGAHIVRTDLSGRVLLGVRDGDVEVWSEESVGAPG
ncbi:ComEC/Rec2 family competence protein [Microbacterium sp. XT11]|uniref:ComEC/Rec2 family competence protein n=1 Tax=Microbacterium sp. XT11 TaxID=367477 RepID=UPI000836189C|nr:ComEC/Rec2 family competence protein [Microbacterium sp. XT11]